MVKNETIQDMKKLPIGIQTFADIRQGDFVYIDKTPHVHALTKSPKGFYFLSRPRRFGKSLFLDTLHQLFACEKKLFQGLFIEDKWDWDHPYPVIKISCGGGMMRSLKDLADKFEEIFRNNCRELGVEERDPTVRGIADLKKGESGWLKISSIRLRMLPAKRYGTSPWCWIVPCNSYLLYINGRR